MKTIDTIIESTNVSIWIYMLKISISSTPTAIEDQDRCWMKHDADVVLNCTSVSGDVTGALDTFCTTGAAVQKVILDGGFVGGDAVPFVKFPTTNDGVGITVGPGTFNATVGAADGVKVVELTGKVVVGVNVVGGLVGTVSPTIALQLGESKLAQMGVKDAYDDAVKNADI